MQRLEAVYRYLTMCPTAEALGASMHVYVNVHKYGTQREGEGTRGKTGKGRLNPDKTGFWYPKTKRFGFYSGSNSVKNF